MHEFCTENGNQAYYYVFTCIVRSWLKFYKISENINQVNLCLLQEVFFKTFWWAFSWTRLTNWCACLLCIAQHAASAGVSQRYIVQYCYTLHRRLPQGGTAVVVGNFDKIYHLCSIIYSMLIIENELQREAKSGDLRRRENVQQCSKFEAREQRGQS